ncbi:MAG: o-succinylbenzoate synthase [Thainema sp.]
MVDGDCLVEMGQVAVEYLPYRRSFRQPLRSHHGAWTAREGILLKVTDEQGEVGFGEIAPLEWFGSESLADALAFCEQLPQTLTPDCVNQIPDTLPATQMGFESAFNSAASKRIAPLTHSFLFSNSLEFCGLLPTGKAALTTYSSLYQQGYHTFKVKIGVADRVMEQAWLNELIQRFSPDTKLRLDANGGLTVEDAHRWLEWCDRNLIEFLEQPLSVDQFISMQTLAEQYQTPLALDESVATLTQLQDCYQKGWRGIFVVKSAIAGSPRKLHQFCQQHPIRLVFSTVFETVIGRQAALSLAVDLNSPDLAVGFGVGHWFGDDWDGLEAEELWERVGG